MLEVTIFEPNGKQKNIHAESHSLMIGKATANDICLQGDGVSRYHARLSYDGKELIVEDVGSTNGTYVNAERIEKTAITSSDRITIGPMVITAAYREDDEVGEQEEQTEVSRKGEEDLPAAEVETTEAAPTEQKQAEVDSRISVGDEFYWKSLSSFLGPIWHFIEDDGVSEIMINGPGEIYIERKGKLEEVHVDFSEDKVRAAVLNIAQYVGRRVSEDEPYLDARLPDGSRVAVLLPPCARKGISISIRKFAKEKLTLEKLIGFGSLSSDMVTFLDAAVILKKNIIISGGTSSGKTSLLNLVAGLIPGDERILTIEDSAELQLHQDHIVPMETKAPDKKGRGQVTIRDLVRASLRMRPDRIVVGEIRGGEAIDLLQAMNTGHSGSMTTLHASSSRQALNRLETLALFSGLDIPMYALREQVSSAIDLVVQAARLPDHSRKVTHITEIAHLADDGTYVTHDIFRFVRSGLGKDGKIEGEHEVTDYVPSFTEEMELAGLNDALALFNKQP